MIMEEKIVNNCGTELYTDSIGIGPAIIFCDGLGCDGYAFKYLRYALAKNYKTIYWNYRGHGRSAEPTNKERFTINSFRHDLLTIMNEYKLASAIFIGYSMGSMIALDFAAFYPNKVKFIISICGSYGEPLNTPHSSLFLSLFSCAQKLAAFNPELVKQVWGITTRFKLVHLGITLFETNRRLVRFADFAPYFNHLKHMDANAFVWTLKMAQEYSVEEHLKEISCPTLIVAAEKDNLVPINASKHMAQIIPNAQLFVMRDCSHAAPIEMPELLELRVDKFLRDNGAENLKKALYGCSFINYYSKGV